MFNDVKDRFQSRDLKLLNRELIEQPFGIKSTQCIVSFGQGLAHADEQFFTWNDFPLRKLSITITRVGSATQANHDPLTDVATQVQQEISNAV